MAAVLPAAARKSRRLRSRSFMAARYTKSDGAETADVPGR
jgi:hypothetical protein